MATNILQGKFILICLTFLVSYCHSLNLYGRSVRYMNLDEKLDGLCQYIENIDDLLTQTEIKRNHFDVAWAYGYLAALLSIENDKLRSIINTYNMQLIQKNHTQKIFKCIQKFFSKLTLSNYIQNQEHISNKFKVEYLPATEDIRAIMESGVSLSLYLYDPETPDVLRDRFLHTYDKREVISDPVNKIFEIFYPKNVSENSTSKNDFISLIQSWSKCDSNHTKLFETLIFLNSLQRYLISGLFAEEFHLFLKFKDQSDLENLKKYLNQLENHRKQYRTILHRFTQIYNQCYTSLKRNLDYQAFLDKSDSKKLNWSLKLQIAIILSIFAKFYF